MLHELGFQPLQITIYISFGLYRLSAMCMEMHHFTSTRGSGRFLPLLQLSVCKASDQPTSVQPH